MNPTNLNYLSWQRIFDVIPNPIIAFTKDLSFFYSNKKALDLWNLSCESCNVLESDFLILLQDVFHKKLNDDSIYSYDFNFKNQIVRVSLILENEVYIISFDSTHIDFKDPKILEEFFHNFNNPMFIVSGKLKQLKNKINRNELDQVDLMKEIDVCLKSISRVTHSVRQLKDNL